MQACPLWILGTWLKKSVADVGANGLDPKDHVMNQSLDYIDIWIDLIGRMGPQFTLQGLNKK